MEDNPKQLNCRSQTNNWVIEKILWVYNFKPIRIFQQQTLHFRFINDKNRYLIIWLSQSDKYPIINSWIIMCYPCLHLCYVIPQIHPIPYMTIHQFLIANTLQTSKVLLLQTSIYPSKGSLVLPHFFVH